MFKFQEIVFATDIEIGADVQTMSAEIVANYEHFWIAEDYCHTRANLGILAWLEILQTCKLDHNVAIQYTMYMGPLAGQPVAHPHNFIIISLGS